MAFIVSIGAFLSVLGKRGAVKILIIININAKMNITIKAIIIILSILFLLYYKCNIKIGIIYINFILLELKNNIGYNQYYGCGYMEEYRKRIIDDILVIRSRGKGAVLVEGIRESGKTTTCKRICNSYLYMEGRKESLNNVSLADIEPSILLKGEVPRLIDEWQEAPKLWDAIRFEVDHRNAEGQFILTGSAVPVDTKEIVHSGTGRFSFLTMRPMTLYESGESNGAVSLKEVFTNNSVSGVNELSLSEISYLCCRGGWPRSLYMDRDISLNQAYDYIDGVVKSDISRASGVQRNADRTRRILRSYARNIGTQASYETIRRDVIGSDIETLDEDTVYSYINDLKKIFVIEDVSSWNPNLRSKSAIRTSDTRYFVDPSIVTTSLGLGPDDLLSDLNTFGFVFENLCIRDLRVYAESINGEIYHYRDATDLECDCVVHLRNGSYGLIEIKIGGDKLIEEGASNLLKLKDKIDTDRMNNPSFLMIVTAIGSYAFRRPDGVLVVPIGCLKN